MLRKLLAPTMLAALTVIASLGFASLECRLVNTGHSPGYVQQSQAVQG